ncbi:cysteine desulfurase [candidate division WWE3 bacterium CG_4_9_14_0_2_um_filter_35_11]|uniref:Cysteine desulfurase n=1 Tax=candidate division WWE3 bacterium CG_4_9_14_0_2_um_filter_35_11 TaxID=1975077 RepID=A0A2M8ELQ4_UNCKA|nr:MAG: cysteine desulfurase [candidate division WWE3 bacterium CG_4_9_14_0_2_um_filter_35_11]
MIKDCRSDFPILKRCIHGKRLAYLDSAATSQISKYVLDAIYDFEVNHRANVHRGVHTLSEEASQMFEDARLKVSKFIGAVVPREVVFTSGCTDSINLVAYSWGLSNLKRGDVVLVSEVEHHSNFVPWQEVCKMTGAEIKYISVDSNGDLDIKNTNVDWEKVKLVAFTQVSNVLGRIIDVKNVVKIIKKGYPSKIRATLMPKILVDGSQAIAHLPVNVQSFGIDFYAFSGHKMYGPMGIGVLWVNKEIFDELKPFKFGGGMINEVTYENSNFADMPERLEAGTPNVSGAIGIGAACDYISNIEIKNIVDHDKSLMDYVVSKLREDKDVIIYGSPNSSLISFNVKNIPSHDLASVLDTCGVAVRSGHHCVMPWHKKQNVTTTVRVSFGIYSGFDDIDQLMEGIKKAKGMFL